MNKNRIIKTIVNGKEFSTDKVKEIISPIDNEIIGIIQMLDIADLAKLELPKTFSHATHADLIPVFIKLKEYLEKEKLIIAKIAVVETGSPIKYHIEDIDAVVRFIEELINRNIFEQTIYKVEPKGRILINLSANEPITLTLLPLLSALWSGNTIYIKPSSKTPGITYTMVRKLVGMGLNPALVNIVTLNQDSIYNFIDKKYIDFVLSFGSTKTNRLLKSKAIQQNIDFDAENEGNDWMYISKTNGFKLEELSKLVLKSLIKHNGQMCDSLRGILVDKSLINPLFDQMSNDAKCLNLGDPMDISTDVGFPLIDTIEILGDYIEKIKMLSIKTYIGSSSTNSRRISPIFFITSKLVKEYTMPPFLPILWFKSVNNVKEVINYYNKYNIHGLGFSIISSENKEVIELTSKIKAGRININTCPVDIKENSPWGGVKRSGNGGPRTWFERFTDRKIINYGQF